MRYEQQILQTVWMAEWQHDAANMELDDETELWEPRRAPAIWKLVLGGVVVGIIGIMMGVLIGYFGRHCNSCAAGPCLGPHVPRKIIEEADATITEKIKQKISADNIRDNLK